MSAPQKRGGPLLFWSEVSLPAMWCTPPRGGGEGHLNSIVLGACHPTPALSDESEIISRALHWTAGSEWLRPVKHPCVVVCMGLGSLAGRRDGDERQRGARAGARCRPCRQEAQHSNSARVDFGDLLEALSPPRCTVAHLAWPPGRGALSLSDALILPEALRAANY